MMKTPLQEQEQQYGKRYPTPHPVFFIMIVVFLVTGAILWILNIEAVISGPWSNILGVVFTVLTVLFAFLEWYKKPLDQHDVTTQNDMTNLRSDHAHLGVTKRKGALLVWTKKNLSGKEVHLRRGFDVEHGYIDVAGSVIELKNVQGRSSFVAIIASLEPGNYTVSLPTVRYYTNITVRPERVTEIDLRYIHIKSSQKALDAGGKQV